MSECPFALAGWTHKKAARIIATDRREREGDIVAVEGKMPVGVLTMKSKPRANNHEPSIVSPETIDPSVFE